MGLDTVFENAEDGSSTKPKTPPEEPTDNINLPDVEMAKNLVRLS